MNHTHSLHSSRHHLSHCRPKTQAVGRRRPALFRPLRKAEPLEPSPEPQGLQQMHFEILPHPVRAVMSTHAGRSRCKKVKHRTVPLAYKDSSLRLDRAYLSLRCRDGDRARPMAPQDFSNLRSRSSLMGAGETRYGPRDSSTPVQRGVRRRNFGEGRD